jgi:hypothetical protein
MLATKYVQCANINQISDTVQLVWVYNICNYYSQTILQKFLLYLRSAKVDERAYLKADLISKQGVSMPYL